MTKKKSAPTRRGLSARAQWGVIIGAGVLIVGGIIALQIRDQLDPGGVGVVTLEDWDLPALDQDTNPEGRVRLADFSGTPTVVNFFASWCDACDDELPAFREVALALEGQVDFVFVNSNETGNWRSMAERNDIEQFALAKDIEGTRRNGLYRSLRGTGGMPITAFYDADGHHVDTAFTAFNRAALEQALQSLGFL